MAKEQTYSTEYINDLVKRSRASRSTVYRKIKAGWTEAEIIAGRRADPDDPPAAESPREPDSIDELFPVANIGPQRATPKSVAAVKAEVSQTRAAMEQPVSVDPPDDEDTKFVVTWARAVLWAVDHVDVKKSQMTKTKAGSALKYNMYLLGKDDLRELHVNLVPKALNILDKNKNPEGGDIAAAEEKDCDELEVILKQALEESRAQWIERN